jgi:hypothetical protein
MSDGRFAVLGGITDSGDSSSCEALMVTADGHWVSLLPMHRAQHSFICAAVARCTSIAGGRGTSSGEVCDEALNRWIQLPCDLPGVGILQGMCSAPL